MTDTPPAALALPNLLSLVQASNECANFPKTQKEVIRINFWLEQDLISEARDLSKRVTGKPFLGALVHLALHSDANLTTLNYSTLPKSECKVAPVHFLVQDWQLYRTCAAVAGLPPDKLAAGIFRQGIAMM